MLNRQVNIIEITWTSISPSWRAQIDLNNLAHKILTGQFGDTTGHFTEFYKKFRNKLFLFPVSTCQDWMEVENTVTG